MPITFAVGGRFELNGIRYTVLSAEPLKSLIAQRDTDLAEAEFPIETLLRHPSFRWEGTGLQPALPPKQDLPPHDQEDVAQRLATLEPLILLESARSGDHNAAMTLVSKYPHLASGSSIESTPATAVIEWIACQRGISQRTIWRYWRSYRLGGMRALGARTGQGVHSRKDIGTLQIMHPRTHKVLSEVPVRLSPKQIEVLSQAIATHYLNSRRPRVQEIVDRVAARCIAEGIKPLDYSTVRKVLGRIPPGVSHRYRDSMEDYQLRFEPNRSPSEESEPQYPMQIVHIDHCHVDVDIVDPDSGEVIGRPWLTIGIDPYDNMVWCMHLGWQAPSAQVVREAIEHGIFPKDYRSRYGTMYEWDKSGVPAVFTVDNGTEFHDSGLERAITINLQSEIRYRPPGKPRFGSKIERYFGTLNTQFFHRLAGTRKSRPEELGGYDPEQSARLTLEQLERLLVKYIVDIYQFKRHRGLPESEPSPRARYEEALSRVSSPRYVPASEYQTIHIALMPQVRKTLSSRGFQHENIRYSHPRMARLLHAGAETVDVKIDTKDVSHCYVLDTTLGEWVDIPSISPRPEVIAGVSLYAWREFRSWAKKKGDALLETIPGTKTVAEALQQWFSEADQAGNTRRGRTSAARVKESISPKRTFAGDKVIPIHARLGDLKLADLEDY